MTDLHEIALALFSIEKVLAPGQWVPVIDATGRETARKIECRFAAAHPEIDRLRLDIYIRNGLLGNVRLHAHLTQPGIRASWQVYRLDVRQSVHHQNKIKSGHPMSGKSFPPGSTHEHHFADSTVPGMCDFARETSENVTNIDEAFRYVCRMMHITGDLPPPEGQALLI